LCCDEAAAFSGFSSLIYRREPCWEIKD
jgi:hypothetical protein